MDQSFLTTQSQQSVSFSAKCLILVGCLLFLKALSWAHCYELHPKLRHRHKNGRCSVGTFVKFVWATMGRKFLNGDISAKKEDIKL